MNLFIKRAHLVTLVIAGSIFGYPAVSVLSALIEVDNQELSIVFRGIIAICALLMFTGKMGVHARLAFTLFTAFWIIYLLRIAYNFGVANETASQPASTYFIWSVGVCIIPSLAILLYQGEIIYKKIGMAMSVFGAFTMVGILLSGGTAFETSQGVAVDQNRWNLSTLSPIMIGHLGASLVILAFVALMYGKSSASKIVFQGAIASTGIAGLFLANSRGPLVALLVAILVYGLVHLRSRRLWLSALLIPLLGFGVAFQSTESIFGSNGLVDRFRGLLAGEDMSVSIRNEIYANAFAQFVESPLLGDGVEVRAFAYYPHNAILEAFMVSGIIGGLPFLIFTVLSLHAAFRIIKSDPKKSAFAMLAIQYIIAAQFSGAIYQWGAMWVAMALVLSWSAYRGRLDQR